MRIAFLEPFPILQNLLGAEMKKRGFADRFFLDNARRDEEYDLLLSDLDYYSEKAYPFAEVTLLSGSARILTPPPKGILISLGMNADDTVTLSSISEDRAMLCLQREIRVFGMDLGPFEKNISFDRNFSLYKNLSAGFALCLAEYFLGEEIGNDSIPLGSG